jgi:hypothetical protein
MVEKKVITAAVENNFICLVIRFAADEGMTISNIKEAMEKAYVYMEGNATLTERLPELSR